MVLATILSYFVVISSGRLRFYKTFLARDEQSALKGRQIPSQRCQWAGGEGGMGGSGLSEISRVFGLVWFGLREKSARLG